MLQIKGESRLFLFRAHIKSKALFYYSAFLIY
jgi:hypothetical protein